MYVVKTGQHPAAFCRTAMAILLAASLSTAFAAEPVVLDIPAQDLTTALKLLSKQANVQILFPAGLVQDKHSKPIKGSYTPEGALRMLLQDSNLSFVEDGANTFAVRPQAGRTAGETQSFLDEVAVTATRVERRIEEIPASISVITSHDIAHQHTNKVQDLLRNVEGIDFGQQESVAHAAGVSLRGVGGSFAGNTTQLLVDGMATDNAVSAVMGRGGLNFMAAQDIKRIEVLRGSVSAVYGFGVIGGAVNVIPKRWKGKPGVEVNAAYGSHNTRSAGAAVGAETETMDVRLSIFNAQSDGFIAQPNLAFGGKDLGPRDWKDNKVNFLGGFRPTDNQEVTLGIQNYGTRSALLGGHPNLRQNMDGEAWTLGYRYDFGETATIKANYRKTRLKQQAVWDQEYWNGIAGDLTKWGDWGRFSDSDELGVQVDARLTGNNLLIAGYSHSSGKYTSRTLPLVGAQSVSVNEDKVDSVFIQDEQRFGNLGVTIGGRQDRIAMFGDTRNGVSLNNGSVANVFNPRLGATYKLSDATSFYASAGTAYLPAGNSFKFVQPSPTRIDNPNLKPESSVSYEIGLNQRFGWGSLRAALFQNDYKDKITLIQNAIPGKAQWQNINKVAVNGLELDWQGQFADAWHPYANYAYTDSTTKVNQSDPMTVGKKTQRVSPHKLNLGVTYEPGSTWAATFNGRYVGSKYFDDRNTTAQHAGGFFVADAKVSAKLPVSGMGNWDAYIAANNIFGKVYQEWAVYEYSDRRTVTVGVNAKF